MNPYMTQSRSVKVTLGTVNEEGRATLPARARRFTGTYEDSGMVMLGLIDDDEEEGIWTVVEVHDNGKITIPESVRDFMGFEGRPVEDVEVLVDEA